MARNDGTESPTPERIFAATNGFQLTQALKAAVELEVFTAIAGGATSADELAERLGVQQRGVRILCDFLTVHGLLNKQDGRYGLPEDAALFLDKNSPAYLGSIVRFVNDPELVGQFDNLAELIRNGVAEPEGPRDFNKEQPMWREFARSMAPLMRPAAEFMAEQAAAGLGEGSRLLDVAAGHGLFGIVMTQRAAGVVEVTALDWPGVLEVARENAAQAGLGARHRLLAGDALGLDWGDGYDLVLLANFLHHFPPAQCTGILERAYRALKPGGRAFTLEFVPNEDRITPPGAAAFSMQMLGGTAQGDAYTFGELERFAADAGFARSELIEMPGPQSLVVSYR